MPRFAAAFLLFALAMSLNAQYRTTQTVIDGVDVVQLENPAANERVSVAVSLGNLAYEFSVNGKNAFYAPMDSLGAYTERPRLAGNPFLWPWPNRLDWDGYYFDGKEYRLNMALGNVRPDGNKQPIHGLVTFSNYWEVIDAGANANAAWVTSQLKYSKHPELAQQFPFEHRVEMTYQLSGGRPTVTTKIVNLSAGAMPVSLGFHPYFQLHDSPRDEWKIRIAAKDQWLLNDKLTPTTETAPTADQFPNPLEFPLAGAALDHVFGGLLRDQGGRARFSLMGKQERIDVFFHDTFDTSVIYAPTRGAFVCFEPMAGITNALNLQHRGTYKALQSIKAGETWEGRFAIQPIGF
jgi:aldose 1-epimerase